MFVARKTGAKKKAAGRIDGFTTQMRLEFFQHKKTFSEELSSHAYKIFILPSWFFKRKTDINLKND